MAGRGLRTEKGGRASITRKQNRKPKTENRKPKTENRKPKTENRKPNMKTLAEYQDDVPTWALCSIYNGDDSGLEAEEIEQVNRWCKQWQDKAAELGGHVVYSTEKDDDGNDVTDEFNRNPAFGLACSTESTVILILGADDER